VRCWLSFYPELKFHFFAELLSNFHHLFLREALGCVEVC